MVQRNTVPKSEMVQKIDEFKSKKTEIIHITRLNILHNISYLHRLEKG